MKTILITGGAGFIGSHLCDFLLNKSFKVICMDNFITGDKKNIEHLKKMLSEVAKVPGVIKVNRTEDYSAGKKKQEGVKQVV